MIPDLLFVALDFYRQPRRFDHLRNPGAPLPAGLTELLAAPGNCLAEEHITATAEALGATEEDVTACVPFFIKQVLLEPDGTHYRLMGLDRDAEQTQVKEHYFYLMRLFHPDKGVTDEGWDDLYAPRINEAYNILRNPARRREYDESLDRDADFGAAPMPAGFSQPATSASDPSGALVGLRSIATRPAFFAAAFAAVLFFLLVALFSGNGSSQLSVERKNAEVHEPRTPYGSVEEVRKDLEQAEVKEEESPELVRPAHESRQSAAVDERAADQRVEDIIKARVARATTAVLGSRPPPQSTRQPAASPKSRPRTVTKTNPSPAREQVQKDVKPEPSPDMRKTAAKAAPQSSLTNVVQPVERETPTAVSQDQSISLVDLDRLLAAFATAYQTRDSTSFAGLFTRDAFTPDARGRKAIEALYADFFAANDVREFVFGSMTWNAASGNSRAGSAEATITTAPRQGGEPATVETTISFKVNRDRDGSVKISRMTY